MHHPKKMFYLSYSSLYIHQSCGGPKFTLYDLSTLNYLLFSATQKPSQAFEHITVLVLPGMPQINLPSNSLLILALLTQGSLFLLYPGRYTHSFPWTPMPAGHAFIIIIIFFFLTSYSFVLSIRCISSFLQYLSPALFVMVAFDYYL